MQACLPPWSSPYCGVSHPHLGRETGVIGGVIGGALVTALTFGTPLAARGQSSTVKTLRARSSVHTVRAALFIRDAGLSATTQFRNDADEIWDIRAAPSRVGEGTHLLIHRARRNFHGRLDARL